MAERLQIVLADRQEGKTTRLVEWLLQGHLTEPWPGWSRMLLVPTVREAVNLPEEYHWADLELRMHLGVPGGLGKIICSANEISSLRLHVGRNPDLEIALDNADHWLQHQLGFDPALLSLTGSVYDPKEHR